jgi:hypothetical protein
MQRARAGWRHVATGVLALTLLPLVTAVAAGSATVAQLPASVGARTTSTVGGNGNSANTSSGQIATSYELGNGVKHVIEITFDNVHFFRDNPNVPSDLEMMPNLLNFFEQNDILTTLTGT